MSQLQSGQNLVIDRHQFDVNVMINAGTVPLNEIDVSAYLLGANKKVRSDDDFIFYNQPASEANAVQLKTITGGFAFSFDVSRIPSDVIAVPITIAIHSTHAFSDVASVSVSVNGLFSFSPNNQSMSEKALILGEVYKHNDKWKFKASGMGFYGGLGPLAINYGVDVAGEPNESDTVATPAVSLEKTIAEKAPRLVNLAKSATVSLEKNNLTNIKARVGFVLDCSGSMSGQFKDGHVQSVLDRIAVLAVQFDDDMALDLWAFATKFKKCSDVTLSNIDGYIDRIASKKWFLSEIVKGLGFGNNEPPVMEAVVEHYQHSTVPAYVIFITDGGVYENSKIEKIVRDASDKPIFWQCVGLGGHGYGVLEKLDDMGGRVCDNADFFAIDDFATVKDDELYARLLNEFPLWLKDAKAKGVL
ncbi:VWA domain-containing protein [Photobacterium japonica]|uniref:vWA domain-containing protein n=1 Tax=Photobacterium japonica TaxID=2910235 RepID=UPI003D109A7D